MLAKVEKRAFCTGLKCIISFKLLMMHNKFWCGFQVDQCIFFFFFSEMITVRGNEGTNFLIVFIKMYFEYINLFKFWNIFVQFIKVFFFFFSQTKSIKILYSLYSKIHKKLVRTSLSQQINGFTGNFWKYLGFVDMVDFSFFSIKIKSHYITFLGQDFNKLSVSNSFQRNF